MAEQVQLKLAEVNVLQGYRFQHELLACLPNLLDKVEFNPTCLLETLNVLVGLRIDCSEHAA